MGAGGVNTAGKMDKLLWLIMPKICQQVHEELRKRIAHNGYLKVCEMFRFDDRIKYMLEIADEK